ncbi:hypothetical protein ACROYT_G031695 [Oculina patagonica]
MCAFEATQSFTDFKLLDKSKMASNTGITVLFLMMAILCMQAAGRDLCEKKTQMSDGNSFVTQMCTYNGCFGCYAQYAGSAAFDQDCKDYYNNVNGLGRFYKCCIHTPDNCPKPAGPWGDTPFKRFFNIARRQEQHDA